MVECTNYACGHPLLIFSLLSVRGLLLGPELELDRIFRLQASDEAAEWLLLAFVLRKSFAILCSQRNLLCRASARTTGRPFTQTGTYV